MSVMESRSDRPGREAEQLGDLRRGVSDEVMQDEDRALFRCKPSESTVELVAIGDRQQIVGRLWTVHRQHPEIRRTASLPGCLSDTHVGEEAMDPRVEPVRIAEARKVTPGDHQRILQGIFGPIDVAEDPMRDREESVASRADQVDECRLVATLRRLDEVAIHRHHPGV
jgi:hypothetical protein